MRLLGMLVAMIPLAFGVVRAWTTGSDFRYVWVGIASSTAAGLVASTARPTSSWLGPTLRAVAAGTVAAVAVAVGVGARSVVSVLLVGAGFGLCSGVGLTWVSRRRAA